MKQPNAWLRSSRLYSRAVAGLAAVITGRRPWGCGGQGRTNLQEADLDTRSVPAGRAPGIVRVHRSTDTRIFSSLHYNLSYMAILHTPGLAGRPLAENCSCVFGTSAIHGGRAGSYKFCFDRAEPV
jgi:hypothetical protein